MMPDRVLLVVHGTPQPQGSLRAFARNGRAQVTQGGSKEGRQRLGDWRLAIASEARNWVREHGPHDPWDEAIGVSVAFFLPRPPSAPKRRHWPDRKPDLDRLCRAALDALTDVLFVDDARVVSLQASKHYAVHTPPRAEICVYVLRTVNEAVERHPAAGVGT